KVYAKKNAIWAFTVVGRPPQEDTSFGNLIHELTGAAIPQEIPGLKQVNAVDAAGVHPLLLAIGSERYTPYAPTKQPAELLTIANHILGTGQLSLAKFLFITDDSNKNLDAQNVLEYLQYVLTRIDLTRDIHFYTNTTMDTLDYSGTGLNCGSKVVFAAVGEPKRNLATELPTIFNGLQGFSNPKLSIPGVVLLQCATYVNDQTAIKEISDLDSQLIQHNLNNFLWVCFTRCNPANDIHGIAAITVHKHWGCNGPLVIDARIKPHHAPPVLKDLDVEKRINRIFEAGGSLYGKI
ncbi:MAG: UbiD family decarboxylase, partial [Bacteroidetes bacterium]|nr:UbiD family decarboxylase [Bacteroidota bacterium]